MDFNEIKKYKKNEQSKYQEKLKQKRYIPDSSILQKPDEEFIPPIYIEKYK